MRSILLCSVVLVVGGFLLVASRSAGGDKGEKKQAGGKVERIEGELTDKDPLDKLLDKSHHKVHRYKMLAGKVYKIEMNNASTIDPLLRLESPKGEQLAMNDDIGPNNLDARIIFKAPADGEYRIIATTFEPGKSKVGNALGEATGKYSLTIEEIDWKVYLGDILKPFAAKGKNIGVKDAMQLMQAAIELETGDKDLAAEAYVEFGKVLAKASEEKLVQVSKIMTGAARRMKLDGNPITVHGQTLEGKDFDWSKYKGKVVLVDFWATWCGPCREEIPNVKALYEAYHDRGFEVVAISLDADGKEKPAKYMEREKLPWVCLYDKDPGKDLEPLAQYYGVFGIPQAILVNREGRVVSLMARGEELERLLVKHIGPREKGKNAKSDK
jgi:thiol-disulfide isomerase/thioredoxin